jgi:hypothetical protein
VVSYSNTQWNAEETAIITMMTVKCDSNANISVFESSIQLIYVTP